MNMHATEAGEMTIAECKTHYDMMIKQSSASAMRYGWIAIFFLIASIAAFIFASDRFGLTLLIVTIYCWQEANKAEMQGNVVVALYPLPLLLNSYAQIQHAKSNDNIN